MPPSRRHAKTRNRNALKASYQISLPDLIPEANIRGQSVRVQTLAVKAFATRVSSGSSRALGGPEGRTAREVRKGYPRPPRIVDWALAHLAAHQGSQDAVWRGQAPKQLVVHGLRRRARRDPELIAKDLAQVGVDEE